MVMLLKDFEPYEITFMTIYVYYFRFPRHFDGQFTSITIKSVALVEFVILW
jgi:hypothetical protein